MLKSPNKRGLAAQTRPPPREIYKPPSVLMFSGSVSVLMLPAPSKQQQFWRFASLSCSRLVLATQVSNSDSKTAADIWQQVVNKRKALCPITLPEEGAKLAAKLKATFAATSPMRKSRYPRAEAW